MRVLFLDFDGVLNSRDYVERAGWDPPLGSRDDLHIIDPLAVALIDEVLEATGACVVISSSWRSAYSLEELRSMLKERGLRGHVVDVTPELPGRSRSREIAQWLAGRSDVEAFAIVDDNDEAGENHAPNFVQTTFEHGLKREHVEALVRVLR